MKETILLTDGYKLGHKLMYPSNMTKLYSNFTPRGNKYLSEATNGAVVFGIQYFIKEYLIKQFNEGFFSVPEEKVVANYKNFLTAYLDKETADMIGTDHIRELHQLGYLPIKIKALHEGSYCPIGVPLLTITNTHPKFAWLTNYLESLVSNVLWHPITAATVADVFKRELVRHAIKTGFYKWGDISNIDFLCHDFSMRGMQSVESSIVSGMAFLTSFSGSECVPAILAMSEYYDADLDTIAKTVPASEHSVECTNAFYYTNTPDDEAYFVRMLNTFETGFISIVADGYDYWHFLTNIVPKYKDRIISRNGRVVIRPDSGDPVKIICGDNEAVDPFIKMGSYEFLWNTFGGTFNEKGYKVLDPHIGLLYGDSINFKRQKSIYALLEYKGFAATNLVLGVGSFSMGMVSRDSLSMAMKATYFELDEDPNGINIYKDPKTVTGTPKKSHRGLLQVTYDSNDNVYKVKDQCTHEEEENSCLRTVFENGRLVYQTSLEQIRSLRLASLHNIFKND